jgi:hypothetical protein
MAKPERITAGQREELAAALLSGFPTRDRFDELLDFKLDIRPDDYPGGLPKAVRNLITDLAADDRIATLLRKAMERTPNADIRAFHDKYYSLKWPPDAIPDFESMVTPLGFQSLDAWLARANAVKAHVCRLEIGEVRGTGFLVGKDLVLTNYHVVEAVIGSAAPDIILRFDVATEGPGTPSKLAPRWLAGHSPSSPVDLDANPHREAADDELDYALLRTSAAVGETRGWQMLSNRAPLCKVGDALIIVQHPEGEHLQIAFDQAAIQRVGPTRVRYSTNTKHGSSGSPCFDLGWNLVALHHSGDQSFRPIWNEGIPIRAIAKHIDAAIAGSG